jgi:hypothetical protein
MTRLEPYEGKGTHQIVLEVVNDGLRPGIPLSCTSLYWESVWYTSVYQTLLIPRVGACL